MPALLKAKLTIVRLLRPLVRNYVPRWVIFAIDLLIAFVSAQCAFFLVSTINGEPYHFLQFNWELLAIVGIQAIFYFIFRSYFGLIRYSNFRDTIKLLQVTVLSVLSILLINEVYYAYAEEKLILNAGVIMFGFITFSLLFFFRVVVKRLYQVINLNKPGINAYILGTKGEDIAMAEGLISKEANHFNIIGFIGLHQQKTRNRVFNLPIFNLAQLKDSSTIAKAIIVSEKRLQNLKIQHPDLIEELLDLKIKIFKLPKPQDYKEQSYFQALREIKIEDLLQRNPIKLNNQKLNQVYKDKCIFITGAAGSIGSEIVKQLIPFQPKHLILIDQAETPIHELCVYLKKHHPKLAFTEVIANIRDVKRITELFEDFQPDILFHGAAYKHVPMMENNPIEALSVNFEGTRNLAELAIQHRIERFVFVSTDKAVNPTNIMGASKRAAELLIQSLSKQSSATNFITTRFGNVLGSNGSVIPHFTKQIQEKGPVTVTHPEITRYFMTIDEACQLVLEAGAMGNGGEIYVFDMGAPIKIIDLAKHMIRLTGLTPYTDIEIKFTGLRPGEKLYEELLADKETTLATHHEKILIAQASHQFTPDKLNLLKDLEKAIKNNCTKSGLETLRDLIPEYDCPDTKNTPSCQLHATAK